MTATPNHALQRTAPAVTLAASCLRLSPAMQPARQPPPSLSLGSLGVATRTVKTSLLAVLLLLMALPVTRAQAPDISNAPKAMQELSASIQGKRSDEVRAAIIERLGPAQRNVGSGYRIEQWDTADGVLTFHPATGPTFSDPKTKTCFRLLRTSNPAAANILQSYEMMTLPDPANHGTQCWLGNIKFGRNATYQFTDSGQFPKQRAAQTENFFMLHPNGTVEVRYVAPITPVTLLESVAEGATIAHLVFGSADHKHQATFSITSSERARNLVFGSDKPLTFYMDTSWRSFWR